MKRLERRTDEETRKDEEINKQEKRGQTKRRERRERRGESSAVCAYVSTVQNLRTGHKPNSGREDWPLR